MISSDNTSGFSKAISLHQDGSLEQADKLYSQLLKRKPGHTEALHMRGVLKLQQGEHQLAEHLIKKALKNNKADPWIHFHLAEVLAATGRHQLAVAHFKKALEFGANDVDVFYMYANTLFELKQYKDAIANYEMALKLQPGDNDCRLNLSNAYEVAGELKHAISCFEPLTIKNNTQVSHRLQFAELLLRDRRGIQAHTELLKIKCVDSTEVNLVLATARIMHQQIRYESSAYLINLVLPHFSGLDQPQRDLAVGLLIDSGRYAESRELLSAHADTSNRSGWSWFQQGVCAQVAGEFEIAAECHQSALVADQTLGVAAYSLASNGKAIITDELLENWMRSKRCESVPVEQQAQFAFAVARVYDARGNHNRAFEVYQEANALVAHAQPFNIDSWDETIEHLIETFSAEYFAEQSERMQLDVLPNELAGEHLHFIVGMPRSGSTLLEQTLKNNAGLVGLGEHYALRRIVADIPELTGFAREAPLCTLDLQSDQIAELRQQYLASLPYSMNEIGVNSHSSVRYVDKMLGNFLRLGTLALIFPKARILHSCRDPMATGVSCFTNVFGSGLKFSYDLHTMGRAWRSYNKLMQHWHQVLPLKIMDVQYEELVSNPEQYQQAISMFLGVSDSGTIADESLQGKAENYKSLEISNDQAVDNNINTASFWQARQPISTASLYAWKRFDQHLDPLREGLDYKQPK